MFQKSTSSTLPSVSASEIYEYHVGDGEFDDGDDDPFYLPLQEKWE